MHTLTILIATDLENSNKTAFANQILPDVLKDKKEYFSQSKVSITVSMGILIQVILPDIKDKIE